MTKEIFTKQDLYNLILSYNDGKKLLDPTKYWFDPDKNIIAYYVEYSHIEKVNINFYDSDIPSNVRLAMAHICLRYSHKTSEAKAFIERFDLLHNIFEEVTPYNMIPGRTFYKVVIPYSKEAYMTEMVILDYPAPTKNSNGRLFVKVKERSCLKDGWFETKISLLDANIIQNKYNQHKAFYNLESAKEYLAIFKK